METTAERLYLVIARCNLDDVPMGLFSDRLEANRFAVGITSDDLPDAIDALGWATDTSELITISVVRMQVCGAFTSRLVKTLARLPNLACERNTSPPAQPSKETDR